MKIMKGEAMDTIRRALATALPALLLAAAAAQTQAQTIEPGLWEVQHSSQIPGLHEQLKNLPPEARKIMEQQMGIGVGVGKGGRPAIRICLAPEDVQDGPIREGHREGDCTYTQVSRSAKTWKGRIVCTNPPSQGDFTVTLHSPQHYTTHAVMQARGPDGGRMEMDMEARRVSGDCGSLGKAGGKR